MDENEELRGPYSPVYIRVQTTLTAANIQMRLNAGSHGILAIWYQDILSEFGRYTFARTNLQKAPLGTPVFPVSSSWCTDKAPHELHPARSSWTSCVTISRFVQISAMAANMAILLKRIHSFPMKKQCDSYQLSDAVSWDLVEYTFSSARSCADLSQSVLISYGSTHVNCCLNGSHLITDQMISNPARRGFNVASRSAPLRLQQPMAKPEANSLRNLPILKV